MTRRTKPCLGFALALLVFSAVGAVAQDQDVTDKAPSPAQNRLGILALPKTVAATWSQGGQDVNFRGNSLGYGLTYDLPLNARASVGLEYTHSDLRVEASSTAVRRVAESRVSYDVYYATFRYCFSGSSIFFEQICPGFDVGNDAYPILSFASNSTLKLDRLQDIVIGPKLTYQSPITDKVLFRATAGYNYGMGIGSSGSVTSKGNSSYSLKIGAGWNFNVRHGMGLDVFWQNRNAKMRDKTSTVNNEWTTKSTELGVRLAYTFTL